MALEKNLFAVSPILFSADGGADGKITIPNACYFKVKQKVKISGVGLDQLDLEVKRVISDTELYVGPPTGPISDRTNLSAYTTVLSSFIYAIEQKRPSVPFEEHTRAVYEEEPTVALRTILVDKLGSLITQDNPLPVDAILSIPGDLNVDVSHPKTPTIVNHVVAAANTEFFLALPNGTKRFKLRVRDGASKLKMAFATGEIAADRFITIERGFQQEEGDIDLPDSFRIYLESNKADVIVELLSWQL